MKRKLSNIIIVTFFLTLPIASYAQRIYDPQNPYDEIYSMSIPASFSEEDASRIKHEILTSNDVPGSIVLDDNLSASNDEWKKTYYMPAERLSYLMLLKDKASLYHPRCLGEIYYTIHYVTLKAVSDIRDSIELNDVLLAMFYLRQSSVLNYKSACFKIAKLLYCGYSKYKVGYKKYIRLICEPDKTQAINITEKISEGDNNEYNWYIKKLQETESKKNVEDQEQMPEFYIPLDCLITK